MKRCPTCQKEFADSMRFCQTDGTPLVEVAEKAPPPDPYKTVVGGLIKMDDDFLQIPEQNDPMKTMVGSPEPPKAAPPKIEPPLPKPPSEPTINVSPKVESKPQEPPPPPKFSEPSLSPPSFGDLSPSSASNTPPSSPPLSQPPKNDPVPPKPAPPAPFGASPFSGEAGKSESPFSKPSSAPGSSPFDKPANSKSSPPADKMPPPPYKDPEPMFGGQQPPSFNQSPFSQPQTPFGQSNEPFSQQNDWAPPPAPVASWQDQGVGSSTPFQPPVAGGQNQTLAIVSLVCGVLSLLCCAWFLPGIAAVVLGFMAKSKADQNPAEYGGRGMALAGMITGGISIVLGIIVSLLWLLGAFAGNF
jgi:hypothetical protein